MRLPAIPLRRAARLLRVFLAVRQLSQADAARRIQFATATVSRILNGQRPVPLFELTEMVERLGLTHRQRVRLTLNHALDWVEQAAGPPTPALEPSSLPLADALHQVVTDMDGARPTQGLRRLRDLIPALEERPDAGSCGMWLALLGDLLWYGRHTKEALRLWDSAYHLLEQAADSDTRVETWRGNVAVSIADEVARRSGLARADQAYELAETRATEDHQLHHIYLSRAELRLERMIAGRMETGPDELEDAAADLRRASTFEATLELHPADAVQRAGDEAVLACLLHLSAEDAESAGRSYRDLCRLLGSAESTASSSRSDARWSELMSLLYFYRAGLAQRLGHDDEAAYALYELRPDDGCWPPRDPYRATLIADLCPVPVEGDDAWIIAAK